MNKQEFLEELRTCLMGTLTQQEVYVHLQFYNQYIDTGIRNGRAEDKILGELAEPSFLSKALIESSSFQKDYTQGVYEENMAFREKGKIVGVKNMNRQIDVLGIKVHNYFVDEAMELVEEFLENDFLNTVGFISTSLLLLAKDDKKIQENIENLDLSIVSEKEILEATGVPYERRYEEVEKNVFMKAFFMCISDKKKKVFLITEKYSTGQEFETFINSKYSGIEVAGMAAFDMEKDDQDDLINEINGISPDVILAVIDSPMQERFIFKNKQKLNAKIWMGLGHHEEAIKSLGLKLSWLSKLVDKTMFKHIAAKSNSEKGN